MESRTYEPLCLSPKEAPRLVDVGGKSTIVWQNQEYFCSQISGGQASQHSGISISVSPTSSHNDAARFKYYSVIRTGFAHIEEEMEDDNIDQYLSALTHVVDDDCFVFPLPLMLKGKSNQSDKNNV